MPREFTLPPGGRQILEAEGVKFFDQDLGGVPEVTPQSLSVHVGRRHVDRGLRLVDRLYELQIKGVVYEDYQGDKEQRHRWLTSLTKKWGEENYHLLIEPYFIHNKIRRTNMITVTRLVLGLGGLTVYRDPVAMSQLYSIHYRLESQYEDPLTYESRWSGEDLSQLLTKVEVFDQGVLKALEVLSQPTRLELDSSN